MEIGVIGLPQSGKSTFFEIITGVASRGVHEPLVRGQATVEDERLEHIARSFESNSVVPAKIPCVDVNVSGEKAWEQLRQHLSAADGLIHIVDAFSTNDEKDVAARYKKLNDEMVISDLIVAEARLQRLSKMSKTAMKPVDVIQARILPDVVAHLEGGGVLSSMGMGEEEYIALKSFSFWSIKPQLVVLNIDEKDIGKELFGGIDFVASTIAICAKTELELLALPQADRKEFLSALSIEQPAFTRLVRMSFSLLKQICFFTAGKKESRAWLAPRGCKAPQAAGVIHNDFERGFIKAEVVGYDDFLGCGSSFAKAKEAGKVRLEGKEYIIKEADIITFRFNV